MAWIVLFGGWLASILVFHDTWATMVGMWLGSNTFTHGFLILPICLWLIWQRRATVAAMPAAPFWPS
ncbi:MAG: archaeosortase/exosortase family protein, partial [Burkholderiaceae bacterium]|nr:archaeosortase/exosortase family protein [Burkholderiaceae bacterium]